MSLRVPKAEFDGPVEEMVERFGAVPEPLEVMWHNPAVAMAASEFGAKAGSGTRLTRALSRSPTWRCRRRWGAVGASTSAIFSPRTRTST